MSARITTFVLTVGLLVSGLAAQQPSKMPRVGFLSPAQERKSPIFEAFRQGLADLGYVEGKNIEIVSRFAEGQYERFPALIDDLVRAKVDVLAIQGAVTVHAAKKVVKDTPIVFVVVLDPVKDELVPNLEHPGGDVTGVTTLDPQQPRKQFQLLQRCVTGLRRVAILGDSGVSSALIDAAEEQARALGLQPLRLLVGGPNPDLGGAFATMRKEQAQALLVLEEPVLGVHLKEIADLARQDHLPSLSSPIRPDLGELLAYGVSFLQGTRRMANYVDKILRGSKAGDLPVETLTRYELIVNLKTAQEIGITIPPDLLQQADRVIR